MSDSTVGTEVPPVVTTPTEGEVPPAAGTEVSPVEGSDENENENDDDLVDTDENPFDKERALAKIAKTNSEAKGLRKTKTEQALEIARLKVFEDRIKALEDSEKTDLQKALEKITELETAGKTSARAAAVAKLKADHELTDEQLEFLTGDTDEELTSSAAKIVAAFGKKIAKVDTPDAGDLEGGLTPRESTTGKPDPKKLGAAVKLW